LEGVTAAGSFRLARPRLGAFTPHNNARRYVYDSGPSDCLAPILMPRVHDLAALRYDAEGYVLEVAFISGAICRYADVTPLLYMRLVRAKAQQLFFDAAVRGCKPCTRVA
jgi:hypothetical protein